MFGAAKSAKKKRPRLSLDRSSEYAILETCVWFELDEKLFSVHLPSQYVKVTVIQNVLGNHRFEPQTLRVDGRIERRFGKFSTLGGKTKFIAAHISKNDKANCAGGQNFVQKVFALWTLWEGKT